MPQKICMCDKISVKRHNDIGLKLQADKKLFAVNAPSNFFIWPHSHGSFLAASEAKGRTALFCSVLCCSAVHT